MTPDIGTYSQFVLALVFVLALIGVLALVARRLGLGGAVPVSRGRRRLSIVESLPLDGRRRLVLVRRDGAEHLLVLGATSETVVETTIGPAAAEFDDALERASQSPVSVPAAAPEGSR